MKSIKFFIIGCVLFICSTVNGQTENNKSEIQLITEVLMNYIDGTANGEPDSLKKVFNANFNLYSVTEKDSLRVLLVQNILLM